MGNCVRKDFDNQWGGDYWGSPSSSPEKALLSSGKSEKEVARVRARDIESDDRFSSSEGKRATTEVKIKITKKQLEELLSMKEMQGMTIQQVLNQLINGGFESNQRSWRPALQKFRAYQSNQSSTCIRKLIQV